MNPRPRWLEVHQGNAPLIVSMPHTGTDLPEPFVDDFVSPWLARRDTDWWVHQLYDFARDLGATTVRTAISRSIIDVNRDPSGASLYPGQRTTELCPTTTFDDEPLYREGCEPSASSIRQRREQFFDPYHSTLIQQIERLHQQYPTVVVYDAHSIRSRIPGLFDGELPQFCIGTNSGRSCSPALANVVETACAASDLGHVRDGRFKGGWITRSHARPARGIHSIQMELACRGYMDEPTRITPDNWPSPWNPERAHIHSTLKQVLRACLDFTSAPEGKQP